MKKIEKSMLAAVHGRRDWNCGNTRVEVSYAGRIDVYLRGYRIYAEDGTGRNRIFTLAGNNTLTTISRLRALGVNLFRNNGKTYASKCKSGTNAIEIDKYKWYNF